MGDDFSIDCMQPADKKSIIIIIIALFIERLLKTESTKRFDRREQTGSSDKIKAKHN